MFFRVFFHYLFFFIEVFVVSFFLHFDQSKMGLYKLHHKSKWTSCFQAMNIQLLMMIYWTPKKINNLHPQELGHIEFWVILENWWEMAHAYESTWAYTWLHKMLCMWRILCQLTMGFGSWLRKYAKNRPDMTTEKTMMTNPHWLD